MCIRDRYTDNTGNVSNTAGAVTATTDWLWLFAEFEVQGSRSWANQYEQNSQKQYDYFKAGNSKVAYRHSSTGTAVWWWLRSASCTNNGTFCDVDTDGGDGGNGASWSVSYTHLDVSKRQSFTWEGDSLFCTCIVKGHDWEEFSVGIPASK